MCDCYEEKCEEPGCCVYIPVHRPTENDDFDLWAEDDDTRGQRLKAEAHARIHVRCWAHKPPKDERSQWSRWDGVDLHSARRYNEFRRKTCYMRVDGESPPIEERLDIHPNDSECGPEVRFDGKPW